MVIDVTEPVPATPQEETVPFEVRNFPEFPVCEGRPPSAATLRVPVAVMGFADPVRPDPTAMPVTPLPPLAPPEGLNDIIFPPN
jgi:hypothetical protein